MSSDNAFQVMDTLDFIKLNPGMYCGSSYSPLHLFKEIIDNPIDLLLEGKVKNILIDNPSKGHFIVIDDGPGFPREQVLLPDGTYQDSIIASLTKPHSGTKFNSQVAQHGQNGVGTMVVNALSKSMEISVRDRSNKKLVYHYQFIDSRFVKQITFENNETWSTKVEVIINGKFFETLEVNHSVVKQRLMLVNSFYSNCNIYYCNELIPKVPLVDYARNLLYLDNEVPIFKITEQKNNETITVFFTYDKNGKQSSTIIGDVNLNICEGTFISTFTTTIVNAISNYIDNDKITRNDILGQFRAYISLTVVNPRFDSQTKSRFVKNVTDLVNLIKPKLTTLISSQKFFKEHFEFLLEAKAIQTAAKVLRTKKVRVSADNPLKDCINIPGETLYILEGDSAGGTLKQIRDVHKHAYFPLSGKILNTIDKSIDKAVKSEKMKFLLEAIGVDLTKKNQTEFRYENIKIICDADLDGLHIITLTTVALWRYASPLINNKKVSMLLPPLYGATKAKQFIPIYNIKDIVKYENQGFTISRFKGLGEMNPQQLFEVVYNKPIEYVIEPPKNDKEAEVILKCLTDSEVKRNICKNPIFGLDKILSTLTT
jgi:DNA gyrase subunit B